MDLDMYHYNHNIRIWKKDEKDREKVIHIVTLELNFSLLICFWQKMDMARDLI